MPTFTIRTGNYGSNKVDMYSFGIIFYEMCHESFKTEWEEKLTELRRPDFIITPSGIPLYMEVIITWYKEIKKYVYYFYCIVG